MPCSQRRSKRFRPAGTAAVYEVGEERGAVQDVCADVMNDVNDDLEHLRLLALFHYIVAGLAGLCACFPIIHLVIGIGLLSGWLDQGKNGPPPQMVGWIFVGMASVFMLL